MSFILRVSETDCGTHCFYEIPESFKSILDAINKNTFVFMVDGPFLEITNRKVENIPEEWKRFVNQFRHGDWNIEWEGIGKRLALYSQRTDDFGQQKEEIHCFDYIIYLKH